MARDEEGALLWLVEENLSAALLQEIFAAPVQSVERCVGALEDLCATYKKSVFDHVVQSDPEQRLEAGEVTDIRSGGVTYQVTWYEASVEMIGGDRCLDATPPEPGIAFRAVRIAE